MIRLLCTKCISLEREKCPFSRIPPGPRKQQYKVAAKVAAQSRECNSLQEFFSSLLICTIVSFSYSPVHEFYLVCVSPTSYHYFSNSQFLRCFVLITAGANYQPIH